MAIAQDSNIREYTVSELAFALKRAVEEGFAFVRVRGEISGFKQAPSGHAYLTLKDADACLDGVMWRSSAVGLKFAPEDGLEVVCTGRLTTYPGRSKYQIVIERMEPAGLGALMALLEERKKKLAAEGLFDPARKKKIPFLPEVIGVVTSPTGAVIRDILHRLDERFPRHVLVWPVTVQGERAAGEVAAAIAGFNAIARGGAIARPDLLIVARGGGSIEDLWTFNEEIVLRAVAASEIPLISAVGHETDTTLIDLVSDLRAPTPTAAAEMAVPVRSDLLARMLDCGKRLVQAQARSANEARAALAGLARALLRPGDLLALARQRYDGAAERLAGSLRENLRQHEIAFVRAHARLSRGALEANLDRTVRRITELGERARACADRYISRNTDRLENLGKLLLSVSYEGVLERGFALVHGRTGLVRRGAETAAGQTVDIEFRDRRVRAQIGADKPMVAKRAPKQDKQETLF